MGNISSYVKKYLSHPGKTLGVHTLGVCQRAQSLWDDPWVRTSSLCHDLGKLNPNFRKKLLGESHEGLYTNHSYLSFFALLSYIAKYKNTGVIKSRIDRLAVAICILRHHGKLPNLNEIINEDEVERLKEFLNKKPYLPLAEFMSFVGLGKGVEFDVKDISLEADINPLFKTSRVKEIVPDPFSFFMKLRMCFSALVAGDKYDAGNHKENRNCFKKMHNNYSKRLGAFLSSFKEDTELNKVRTEIREKSLSKLRGIIDQDPDRRVFSLTEPTGSGKTATLLSLANEIMLKKKKGYKIIYSLSYLTIIEQVFGIIKEKIFKEEGDEDFIKRIDCKAEPEFDPSEIGDCESTFLKKMKSILNKILKGKNIKDELIDKMLLEDYLESTFNFPIIVTTFVQFFQSFTTASNKGLMRLSSLPKSIFIIDEIQSLPPRLYTFFVAILDFFCKMFDCYAIVSSATMPNFELPGEDSRDMFKGYNPPIELGDFNDFEKDIFNRYEVHILKPSINLEDIADRISNEAHATLSVFNTVRDSRWAYEKIKDKVNCPVFLLNSNFHSSDRRIILEKCKDHLIRGDRFFLISTQLIEAGVDIDFPVVYRDIAPIPSVTQTGGRCNREGKNLHGQGRVYLFRLIDEKNRLRAQYIYNGPSFFFLRFAIDRLFGANSPDVLQEKDLFNIQKEYFSSLSETLEFGAWDEGNLVEQINNFKFGDIGRFSIIPKNAYMGGDQISFYVPRDGQDRAFENLADMWSDIQSYETSNEGGDKIRGILSRRRNFHLHIKKMMDRVVHIHEKNPLDLAEYAGSIFDMYKLKEGIYSPEYGLIKEEA